MTSQSSLPQNFVLVWLCPTGTEANALPSLRTVIRTTETFTDPDLCVDSVTEMQEKKVFLILSHPIGERLLPFVHDIAQLYAIFLVGDHRAAELKAWWKVKSVHDDVPSMVKALKEATEQCSQELPLLSFLPMDTDPSSTTLDQLDPTFMYTKLLKENLLEIDYDRQSIERFVTYCVENDYATMQTLENFRRNYRANESIQMYTREGHLCSMLNRALRNLETEMIMRMGFFVRDLHQSIRDFHREQQRDRTSDLLTLYRGQGVTRIDFQKLIKVKGGLMSFNNFLSTSANRTVALAFAESSQFNSETIGILFVITVDSSISSVPFAAVNVVSAFSHEEEFLFSMHTVFRIGEMKKLKENDRFWQVELQLTSDDDQQLRWLTDRIRQETGGSNGWSRLGGLLMKIGEFNKAEEVFRFELQQENDPRERAAIYNQLGLIKESQGDYDTARWFFQESLPILQQILPPDHPDLATSYNNMALMFSHTGDYSNALIWFERTLQIRQKVLPPTDLNLATSLSNIGMMHYHQGDYKKALASYEKTLDISRLSLAIGHPDLAVIYTNIACAHRALGAYSQAIKWHEKAIEVRQRVLPPNHPSFAYSYHNIASSYEALGEYRQALRFHEKVVEIFKRTFSEDHPFLASSFNDIGTNYQAVGEYAKSLEYHQKALKIREKTLPADHPDFAMTYNNLATLYEATGERKKALMFQEKALEIYLKVLPANHPSLATIYNNLASFYHMFGQEARSFSYHQKALEIRLNTLPADHPDLATSYNNIASWYYTKGEYTDALTFFEMALDILQRTVSPSHPNLQAVQSTVDSLRRKMIGK